MSSKKRSKTAPKRSDKLGHALDNQKPKKRKNHIPRNIPHLKKSITIAVALGFSTISFFLTFWSKEPRLSDSIKVQFIEERSQKISEKNKRAITEAIHKKMAGSSIDLLKITQIIKRKLELDSVRVVMPYPDHLVLNLIQRKPFLGIKLKSFHWVSHSGHIYGSIKKPKDLKLPFLKGIPRRSKKFTRESQSLLIKEAVTLVKNLQEQSYQIHLVEYLPYRGFKVKTIDDIDIFMGRKPFRSRIKRLRKITTRMSAKGVRVSRIELDYNGKAFIKERRNL